MTSLLQQTHFAMNYSIHIHEQSSWIWFHLLACLGWMYNCLTDITYTDIRLDQIISARSNYIAIGLNYDIGLVSVSVLYKIGIGILADIDIGMGFI